MRIHSINLSLRSRISEKLTLPERFKGSIVEKWAGYWHGFLSDYMEVVKSVAKEIRVRPRRTAVLGSVLYGIYSCNERNPDKQCFLSALRHWNNEMLLIPKTLHNPVSAEYLCQLEQAINKHRLRALSLGICTLLWMDNYDEDDCTYPAICGYTGIGYWNFYNKLVDIGFWNRFWRLEWKLQNYDVNYL